MKHLRNPFLYFGVCLILFGACKKTATYGPDIYKSDLSFKVVGYLGGGNFNQVDTLELNKLTYLNLAFANPNIEGNIVFDDNADIVPIIKKGHDAGLKVFASLGGGGPQDSVAWKARLSPENRSAFVAKLTDYVETNNMDGIDVDVEGDVLSYIKEYYGAFIVELQKSLHAKGKGISAAFGALDNNQAITDEALKAFDFINVMVYDETGVWRADVVGPHSPYSYATRAIDYWTKVKKVPSNKLTLGLPFYGFDFTPPARYIDFKEVIKNDPSLAYVDSVGMRYYNGIPMIVRKVELAKKAVGGVMIWEISSDARGDMSLLRALHQTRTAVDCVVSTFYKDEDGDGFGDIRKPFTACKAPEGYVANNTDKDDGKAKVH